MNGSTFCMRSSARSKWPGKLVAEEGDVARVAIWGAGAIGGFVAARLNEQDHQVTLVARPDQVAAINRDGIRLLAPDGTARTYRLPATTALESEPDVILLTVKTQDLRAACEQVREQTSHAPVVAMQNGIEPDQIAADALGRNRVLGASVMCATNSLRLGEIDVLFEGWIILGEPFAAAGPRTEWIRGLLESVAPTYIAPSMRNARWTKLISNLNNGLAAATGLTMPDLAKTKQGRVLSVRLMKEGYQVARACGARLDRHYYGGVRRGGRARSDSNASIIALLQSVVTSLVVVAPEGVGARVLALAGASRFSKLPIHGSTWQSLQRGKPTEIDFLNGAVARLGAEHSVPTPWNTRVVEAVHEVERTARPVPLAELSVRSVVLERAPFGGAI